MRELRRLDIPNRSKCSRFCACQFSPDGPDELTTVDSLVMNDLTGTYDYLIDDLLDSLSFGAKFGCRLTDIWCD